MITETLQAADQLADQGISAEVIDVASVSPLDSETLLASVQKTGRCVIIHEAPRSGGVGAEISAILAEKGLLALQAPINRVTGYDTVMPYYRLEQHYLPNTQDIIESAQQTLAFS